MQITRHIHCSDYPCSDVERGAYTIPAVEIEPEKIKIILISEAAPGSPGDQYYAGGDSLFERTTVLAFNDAGAAVSSVEDILGLGVYLTMAVKCGKTGYGLETATIQKCSFLLERELALFPEAQACLLMGDAAIKAFNFISRRADGVRLIPALPTYKLRGQTFTFRGMRVYPSYLQAGPSFFIEKSKRKMIAEDIADALHLTGALS